MNNKIEHAMFRRAIRHGEDPPVKKAFLKALEHWDGKDPITLMWHDGQWIDISITMNSGAVLTGRARKVKDENNDG